MSNECLEPVRHRFLRIDIPNLKEIVFAASKEIVTVLRHVKRIDTTSMDCGQFSCEGAFELIQVVESES